MPGYMVNYALSPMIAAAIRERMRATIGEWWTGDERWLGHLRDAFYAPGFGERPATLLGEYLGGPLTVDPLLRDLGAG
jgi:hypothetical protein